MPSSLIVNIGKSGDMNIQALQDRLNDAQELKEHAEAVFDDACNAVEVAETHKSDDEVIAVSGRAIRIDWCANNAEFFALNNVEISPL